MFLVVNVIGFSPLDQQLLRFSPLLDYVTEVMYHLLKLVQFHFEDGNFKSGFGIELLLLNTYWTRPSPTSCLLRPDKVIQCVTASKKLTYKKL